MKTLSRFISKFTGLIVAVLSCFDRVIFKGHLALAAPCELEYFVDRVLKVRRTDFMKTLAPQYSDRLVTHALALGRPDVVLARHFEHRGAGIARDDRDREAGQGDGRQHPVLRSLQTARLGDGIPDVAGAVTLAA